jgi:hypothetical protein
MTLKIGDWVRVGEQSDTKQNFMYRGWLAEIVEITGERALVNSDLPKKPQAVSFRAWLPIETLTKVECGETK